MAVRPTGRAEGLQGEASRSVEAAQELDEKVRVGAASHGHGVGVADDAAGQAQSPSLAADLAVGDGDQGQLGSEALAQFRAALAQEAHGFTADHAQARDGDGEFLQDRYSTKSCRREFLTDRSGHSAPGG